MANCRVMVGCMELIVGRFRPINYVPGTVRVRVYPRVRVGLGSNFEYGSGTGTGIGPVLRVRVG